MSVAERSARRARRTAFLCLVATLALTYGAYHVATRPTVRKLQARGWPTVEADLQGVTKAHESSVLAGLLGGSRVRLTFSYETPDGIRREGKQEVGGRFAESIGINRAGYVVFGRTPDVVPCFVDPDDPGVAVLQTSLDRGDWAAGIPLFVLAIGLILTAAERRHAQQSAEPVGRAVARNEGRWDVVHGYDTLHVTAKPAIDPAGFLALAVVAPPVEAVRIAPHPVAPGETLTITLVPGAVLRRPRRLVATLNVGPYNASGAPRHARWTADVFHGALGRDDPAVTATAALPRPGDVPADATDVWLRLAWRTRLGLPWSRVVWLSRADDDERA